MIKSVSRGFKAIGNGLTKIGNSNKVNVKNKTHEELMRESYEKDKKSLGKDWEMVGQDMWSAINQVKEDNNLE